MGLTASPPISDEKFFVDFMKRSFCRPVEASAAESNLATAPQAPPKIAPRLKAAPKIRQFYWCDFPQDAQLPEFWKRRPIVVVSFKNTLHGAVTVIPCSTQAQSGNAYAFPLQTTIDGRAAWAVCDKPTTV
jgi:mRNA interferase MazF